MDNETNAVYENINVVGVYSPGGTNDDIVTTVTGKMFVAETPEHFTYDADGNLLSDGRWNYVWDAENRLVEMSTLTNLCPSVPLLLCHFSYDYMSRRVGKTVYHWISNDWQAVSATAFLYDGWNLISELTYSQTHTLTNFYIWGLDLSGSLQGAGGVGGLLSAVLGTNSVCYTFDANGNVSEILQVSGISPQPSLLAHYEYSPYGEQLVAVGPLARDNPFRFSTKYTDNETRLVYYGYRYYHPGLGRWVSRDPIAERGGLNLYCAFMNCPIEVVDLLGKDCSRATDYHYVGLGALLHHIIGDPNDFSESRLMFFNTLTFPVQCPVCKIGANERVSIQANDGIPSIDGVTIDVDRDFQVVKYDPGDCVRNGSAVVSVQTRLLLRFRKIFAADLIATLLANVELCYDCIKCK